MSDCYGDVFIARVCVEGNERDESLVNQHNWFRKMLYSNNETTCFDLNGHHQVSTTIKKSLYISLNLLNHCKNLMMAIIGRNM